MSTGKQDAGKIQHQPWIHFMAGGIGGTVGAVLTCPLEVIKTRLQSSLYRDQHHLGVRQMIRLIYRQEGIAGLWRGLGPNLVGVIPARAVHFSTYASTKHYLTHELNGGKDSVWIHLLSAASAGVATATLTNPIWLIKTRMQLQTTPKPIDKTISGTTTSNTMSGIKSLDAHHQQPQRVRAAKRIAAASMSTATALHPNREQTMPHYKNSFDCVVQVLRQEGVRGLFRGLSASYLGIVEGTLQWAIYENFKASVAKYRQQQASVYSSSGPGTVTGDIKAASFSQTAVDSLLTAAASKFIAAALTYPHEVLRTRLRQVSVNEHGVGTPRYSSLAHVVRSIAREEGFRAFYGGLTPHLLRTVPNAAIMFLCYESVVFFFKDAVA